MIFLSVRQQHNMIIKIQFSCKMSGDNDDDDDDYTASTNSKYIIEINDNEDIIFLEITPKCAGI